MPKVSCIMSCYKCNKEYLKKTIESILNQSFTDFEYIIADDKFNDFDLKSFVESFNDKRIKFYDNGENLGYSKTHNNLLEKASGEYIALVDSDDISRKDRLKRCVQEMDKDSKLDLISGRIHIFGACRERDDGKEMMKLFESYKDVIVNNTCLALYNRKLTSMVEKCKK